MDERARDEFTSWISGFQKRAFTLWYSSGVGPHARCRRVAHEMIVLIPNCGLCMFMCASRQTVPNHAFCRGLTTISVWHQSTTIGTNQRPYCNVRFPQCLHMKAFSRFPDKWRRPALFSYELRNKYQRPKCHKPMDSPARQLSNAEGCDPIEALAAEKRSEQCLGPCKKKGATI